MQTILPAKNKISQNTKGSFLLLVTSIIWGISFVGQDSALNYIGPISLNCFRMLLGAAALFPVTVLMDRKALKAKDGQKKQSFFNRSERIGGICCGFVLFVSTALQQIGMSLYAPNDPAAGKAGFITAMYIVIVPLLGLAFGSRPKWNVWLSVGLALTGLYLLCFKGGHINLAADCTVFGCAVCFSVHILIVDRFSKTSNGVKLSMLQFLVAGILSVCFLAMPAERALITPENLKGAAAGILYLGLFSCGIAYTLQIVAQKFTTNAAIASVVMSLESVFAALTGTLFGERMKLLQILGCIIMFSAVLLAQFEPKTKTA